MKLLSIAFSLCGVLLANAQQEDTTNPDANPKGVSKAKATSSSTSDTANSTVYNGLWAPAAIEDRPHALAVALTTMHAHRVELYDTGASWHMPPYRSSTSVPSPHALSVRPTTRSSRPKASAIFQRSMVEVAPQGRLVRPAHAQHACLARMLRSGRVRYHWARMPHALCSRWSCVDESRPRQ